MNANDISRRLMLGLLGGAPLALGQGVSSRAVKPQPRGKPTGIPFNACFIDIADKAGLTAPLIYGPEDHRTYILETVGCGCAFIDYDNDGWLDIFTLSGTRLEGDPPGATNRLYKNNRDGTFTDVTAKAGLTKVGWASAVTVGDYNSDGFDDLFVTYWGQNVLYRNNGDGTFTDVTEKAGLLHAGKRWGSGCAFVDYDRNGHLDLVVANYLELDLAHIPKPGESGFCNWKGIPVNCGPRGLPPGNANLYHNNGNGTFTDVTEKAGLLHAGKRWGSGCAFVDYDRNGHLDLVVANYLELDLAHIPKPGESGFCNWKGIPVNCGPRGLPPGNANLYHNNGDGTFTDVTEKSGFSKVKGAYCMTVAAADFDNDGWPDIYIACDSTPSFLLKNNKDGTFTDIGLESGVALNEDGMEQAGMGLGIGDYALTGSLDILKTHFADDTAVLYKNDGKGGFEDVTNASGLGVETRYISWGAGMFDFDNDGYPDLFWVTGSVYPEVEKVLPNYPFKSSRILFRNLKNGKFEELLEQAGPGVIAPHASRGCAFGDFDNDGDVDIVILNLNEAPSLLRNDVKGDNRWIKVKLVGVTSNRSAIGARVTAHYGGKIQAQEVMSQSSFYSANDLRLHFGLGDVNKVDIEIRWPNGKTEKIANLDANHLFTIHEGKGVIKSETFTKRSA